ncbi:MAG: hypothetical protein EBW30_11100, partial [Synechococcaceae bacterium WB7_3xG_012]|nr:hypothetical protein [Synechococcaceae bacterium WB7_3xG_012]
MIDETPHSSYTVFIPLPDSALWHAPPAPTSARAAEPRPGSFLVAAAAAEAGIRWWSSPSPRTMAAA